MADAEVLFRSHLRSGLTVAAIQPHSKIPGSFSDVNGSISLNRAVSPISGEMGPRIEHDARLASFPFSWCNGPLPSSTYAVASTGYLEPLPRLASPHLLFLVASNFNDSELVYRFFPSSSPHALYFQDRQRRRRSGEGLFLFFKRGGGMSPKKGKRKGRERLEKTKERGLKREKQSKLLRHPRLCRLYAKALMASSRLDSWLDSWLDS